MLYIFNKTDQEAIRQFAVLSADDDEKSVLLVSDAVFLASRLDCFDDLDVESFYAAKDAIEARSITVSDDVEIVDYKDMAGLLDDYDKIITL